MAKMKFKIWQLGVVQIPSGSIRSDAPVVGAGPRACSDPRAAMGGRPYIHHLESHPISSLGLPTDSADSARNGNDEKALLPGYYLMLYLRGVVQSIIDSKVRYFGPFMTATEARFLQTSALALGIVDSAVSTCDVRPILDLKQHFLKETP